MFEIKASYFINVYCEMGHWANVVTPLRPRQNGRNFPDDIFNFFNEYIWISIKISLTFVARDSIDNKPALI